MAREAAKTFRDLEVWQKSHATVLEVYRLTRRLPKEELFGLVSQMRRASVSVEMMAGLVNEVDLPPLRSTYNVFHDVMSCIIEQQVHYRSSKYVFQRVMQAAGLEELTPDNFHLLEPCLPAVRLSAAKYEAMGPYRIALQQYLPEPETLVHPRSAERHGRQLDARQPLGVRR